MVALVGSTLHVRATALLFSAALLLAGCNTAEPRITEHRATFAALDPATQKNIRNGIVEPGYSTDMVYMALGKPTRTVTTANGNAVWVYHHEPVTAYNETITLGFRRRIVYDPVKRTNDVVVEAIDPKAFPNLVPYDLRVTISNGRVATVERVQTR